MKFTLIDYVVRKWPVTEALDRREGREGVDIRIVDGCSLVIIIRVEALFFNTS